LLEISARALRVGAWNVSAGHDGHIVQPEAGFVFKPIGNRYVARMERMPIAGVLAFRDYPDAANAQQFE
jgi:hypothetical protein